MQGLLVTKTITSWTFGAEREITTGVPDIYDFFSLCIFCPLPYQYPIPGVPYFENQKCSRERAAPDTRIESAKWREIDFFHATDNPTIRFLITVQLWIYGWNIYIYRRGFCQPITATHFMFIRGIHVVSRCYTLRLWVRSRYVLCMRQCIRARMCVCLWERETKSRSRAARSDFHVQFDSTSEINLIMQI